MNKLVPFVIGMLIAWLMCLLLDKPYSFGEAAEVQRDTVVDTVRIVQPIAKDTMFAEVFGRRPSMV